MKGSLTFASCVCLLAAMAFGQAKPAEKAKPKESEVTTVRTETKTVSPGVNLTSELWGFEDAVPIRECQVDLRFTTRWDWDGTDGDDDVILQPSVVWGAAENLELSANVPLWIGDGGHRGQYQDGNYDTYLGVLWRFREQEDWRPAMALSGTVRIPTGEGSEGIDAEARLVFTNDYDSGLRSHLNVWGKTANGDNDGDDTRDFQYGGVAGFDGPLCSDGAVRWVADYEYRSSPVNGGGGEHLAEAGWEWVITDTHKVGMSVTASLDHAQEYVPEATVSMVWAITLRQ